MAKPSIVLINRVYPPVRGATGRMLRDLARAFARDGWTVTVITAASDARSEYDGPIKVVRVRGALRGKSVMPYVIIWLRIFWAALFLPRTNVIVTMTDPPLLVLAGRLLSLIKRSRHIHWCQDLYPDLLPYVGLRLPAFAMNLLKNATRRAMKKCDKIVVIGRCMARQLTHSGLDPRRIAVIPNWPDFELCNAARQKSSRKAVQIIGNVDGARSYDDLLKEDTTPRFRVLYSGTIGRAHPLDTILDAAEILARENPEIEFVFIGDGPGFEGLSRERVKRDIDNIRILPYQPSGHLREIMESGDVHLITMKHEVEGLLVPCKLYAALAVARPCILVGPQDSEAAKVIRDFRAGDVVPQGDARRLAEAIKRYRLSSDDWFKAYEGAAEAGKIFLPRESLMAWIERARTIAGVKQIGKAA